MTFSRIVTGIALTALVFVLGACAVRATPAFAKDPVLVLLFSSDSKGNFDPCPS